MKQILLVLVVILYCGEVFGDDDKYTTKYDNIDFGEIIASERLLKSYVNCLMDRGRCTPDANELKRLLPDALETDCKKCSEAQKTGVTSVIEHVIQNKREWWNELEAKYDPEGKYWARYKEEWEQKGISLH